MTANYEKLIQQPRNSAADRWCQIEHWWLKIIKYIDQGTSVLMAKSLPNFLFLLTTTLLSGLTFTIWLLPLPINAQPPPKISATLLEDFQSSTIQKKPPPQINEPETGATNSTLAVTVTVTSLITGDPTLPDAYSLSQNYPNPFNSSTVIQYELPEAAWVRLEVYNMLGQAVATLVDGNQQAGVHSFNWNANKFASGIYFYRITAGNFNASKKMVIIK